MDFSNGEFHRMYKKCTEHVFIIKGLKGKDRLGNERSVGLENKQREHFNLVPAAMQKKFRA